MGAAAAGAAATAMLFDLKADAASGMQSAIESVVGFGNTAANTFEGAYEAIKAIWGLLVRAKRLRRSGRKPSSCRKWRRDIDGQD